MTSSTRNMFKVLRSQLTRSQNSYYLPINSSKVIILMVKIIIIFGDDINIESNDYFY